MSSVDLSEKFFQHIAGWEVVMQARALLAAGKVLSSNYTPPVLKGVVIASESSVRTGLVIQSSSDIENLCPCRDSRERGIICAHAIAVGLHCLNPAKPSAPGAAATASPNVSSRPPVSPPTVSRPARTPDRLPRSHNGEPLTVHILLPPNLSETLARGPAARISMVFEGVQRRGRSPLNALIKSGPFQLSAEDARLLDAAELLTGGDTPGMAQFSVSDLVQLLPAMVGHPRITLGRNQPVEVSNTPVSVPLAATLETNGEMTLGLKPGGKMPRWVRGENGVHWAMSSQGTPSFAPLGLPAAMVDLIEQPRRLLRTQVPAFLTQLWPALTAAGAITANFRLEDFVLRPMPPRWHLSLSGGLAGLTGTLQAAYGSRFVTVGVTRSDDTVWFPDPTHIRAYGMRDLAGEQSAAARLRQSGFHGPDGQGLWQLSGQDRVLTFFAREYARLQAAWEVTLDEQLEHSKRKNLEPVTPEFRVTGSGERWFDLEVTFAASGGERFSAAEVQQWLRGGGSRRLKNGKYAVLDTEALGEIDEVLRDCAPEQNAIGPNGGTRYRMSAAQAGYLDSSLTSAGLAVQAPTVWRERAQGQSGDAQLTCPALGPLESVLRPYQRHGVAWLGFLRSNGFGGVLADEMGLGKTLQVLAHLSAVRAARPGLPPCLVVCPTSLVFNWAAEAKKFTPDLRVLVLSGPQRHARLATIAQHDLVITSYALIRRDADTYPDLPFDTVVLDEAQHIKNRRTQNALAVKRLRSSHRLILTGTPLENSVFDLWSLFDFLMPGYLGKVDDFRDRYEVPITKERDTGAMARLGRRLRPFLLRRLKRDVAKELPDKLEQVAYCELNDEQAALYQQLLAATRKEVLEAVGEQGLARSRMLVLTALLRLRQVCCDLRLLTQRSGESDDDDEAESKSPTPKATESSGKTSLFGELMDEILDGGHRVLVFSQFTSMLALLRDQLDADGTPFCYLDGSTTDRGAVVDRFQKDESIPVFLISLKAGGVGLNLTGADTVIHFDPWWNPAVEDQATDRAHRLGQKRVVTSYKLITRGTVEEKILSLQQKKREVIAATLTGEEALTSTLTWEEIQELLS